MQLIKLSEDNLKKSSTPINILKGESYVGNFYDCNMDNNVLVGKIRGNHGDYQVEVSVDDNGNITSHKCMCETSQSEFCKHSAALCLTYIYTPWLFSGQKMKKENIKSFEDLKYYVTTTPLREIFLELKNIGYNLSDIAELLKISTVQLSSIIKDDQMGKNHQLTDPIKLACTYLLEKSISK